MFGYVDGFRGVETLIFFSQDFSEKKLRNNLDVLVRTFTFASIMNTKVIKDDAIIGIYAKNLAELNPKSGFSAPLIPNISQRYSDKRVTRWK